MNKLWTDKLPSSTALIGALLALLILLASLQYYWLGEVLPVAVAAGALVGWGAAAGAAVGACDVLGAGAEVGSLAGLGAAAGWLPQAARIGRMKASSRAKTKLLR
jgi:hypothetical protein